MFTVLEKEMISLMKAVGEMDQMRNEKVVALKRRIIPELSIK